MYSGLLLSFIVLFLNVYVSSGKKISANETEIVDSDDEVYNIIKLRDFLLKNPRYDRISRPVKHHGTTVDVAVALFLSKITELDISSGILNVQASLLMKWKDEHLVWDPEKFGGITKLVFGYREIWTPEITHWNSFDSKSYISRTFDRQSMDVKNDGTVEWFPSATFKSHCSLDLRDFPADTQTCHQSVGLWNQNTSEVNLIPDEEYLSTEPEIKGPIYVSKRFRSQEWDIVDLNMERYEVHGEVTSDNFSAFDIGYTLQRKGSIYSCYILIPYLTASFFFVCSFPLPIESSLRLVFGGLAVVLLVLLSLFLGLVLGNHSLQVPYSLKCIAVNLFLVSIYLLWNQACCSFLGNIPERFSTPPSCFMKIISNHYISKLFCLTKIGEDVSKTNGPTETRDNVATSGDRSNSSQFPAPLDEMENKTVTEGGKDTYEIEDDDDEKEGKPTDRNMKSFRVIQSTRFETNNSWNSLFSLMDKLWLLFYIVTLLVFHS